MIEPVPNDGCRSSRLSSSARVALLLSNVPQRSVGKAAGLQGEIAAPLVECSGGELGALTNRTFILRLFGTAVPLYAYFRHQGFTVRTVHFHGLRSVYGEGVSASLGSLERERSRHNTT